MFLQTVNIGSISANFTDIVRYILFIRYQLLILIALVVIGYGGRKSPLFRGLFLLSNWYSISIVFVTSLLCTRACILAILLIINNAPLRYEVDCLLGDNSSGCINISSNDWRTYIPTILIALFIIVPTYIGSKKDLIDSRKSRKERGIIGNKNKVPLEIGLVLGAGIGTILFSIGYLTEIRFNNFVNTTFLKIPFLFLLKFVGLSSLIIGNNLSVVQTSTLSFLIVLFLLHVISGYVLRPDWEGRFLKAPPTMMFALLLFSWSAIILSGLSFIFDYYRLPILVAIPTFSLLVFWLSKGDYFFPVEIIEKSNISEGKNDYFVERINKIPTTNESKNIIVICAAGGGIQAAAWTAKVLSSLEQSVDSFKDSIVLMSGVSGGSAGAMFFLDGFDTDRSDKEDAIVKAAAKESLDATGWGLAHADFWRFIGLGWLIIRDKFRDRGWAIEQNWKESFVSNRNSDYKLSNLREKITDGSLPIPIFNATLVETGTRLLISPLPLDLPSIGNHDAKTTDIFKLYHKNADMNVTTAVRLSASFPYVSPISRAYADNHKLSSIHIGDGGYFDNYGVFSALEWLKSHGLDRDEGYSEKDKKINKVLLLQIVSFPESKENNKQKHISEQKPNNKQNFERRKSPRNGWITSLFGPIFAAINVREGAQKVSADAACKAFSNSANTNQERFVHSTIYFPSLENYNPPLSWKLSQVEIENIQIAWNNISPETTKMIKNFLDDNRT